MALALWLALQAAPEAGRRPPIPSDFDLARVRPAEGRPRRACTGATPDEIVVCGRRRPGGDDYPLEEMARRYEDKPVIAEVDIGGGAKARAYVDSATMPDGTISKRAMVGVKLPF